MKLWVSSFNYTYHYNVFKVNLYLDKIRTSSFYSYVCSSSSSDQLIFHSSCKKILLAIFRIKVAYAICIYFMEIAT